MKFKKKIKKTTQGKMFFKYVVVGGGVAGVSCAEELAEVTEEKWP